MTECSDAELISFETKLKRRIEHDAADWQSFKAFLSRRAKVFQTLSTISITFSDQITASEYKRFILHKAARK